MKVPLSWLKEFVDIDITPAELGEKLLLSGTKVEEIKKKGDDYIFDLEITSNRPDTMSVVGLAREIAVILDKELVLLSSPSADTSGRDSEFGIKDSDTDLITAYSALVVDDLKIKRSSPKIAERLEKSAVRPLLNLIDITNYVMLETGIPMHAFDYDRISGHIMNIRESREGESLTTLDGVKRKLMAGTIIIEDNEKIVDLAGIMGCGNSEIKSSTKRSLLLVAIYEPLRIRKASQHLNLRTEASSRFEKLLDLESTRAVLDRAVELVKQECGGRVSSKVHCSLNLSDEAPSIELDIGFVSKLLGAELSMGLVERIFKGLGFKTIALVLSEKPTLQITPPSWRRDIKIREDLVEEVGRIYGYNNLPLCLPTKSPPMRLETKDFDAEIKHALSDWGIWEIVSYTLKSKSSIENLGQAAEKFSKVSAPTSSDFEYLRPNLLIGLLEAASQNQKLSQIRPYFEIGRVFPSKFTEENLSKNQTKNLSILYPTKDLLVLKGYLEALLTVLKIPLEPDFNLKPLQNNYLDKATSSEIFLGNERLGLMGKVGSEILSRFDLSGDWQILELNLDKLIKKIPATLEIKPIPQFPSIIQDIALIVDRAVPIQELVKNIKSLGGNYLKKAQVFDVYTKGETLQGKKSVSVHLTFVSEERTLTESEVNTKRVAITKSLEKLYQAQIR